MPIDKSKKYFHGKEGYNCAQAIAAGFGDHLERLDSLISDLKNCGGGKAKEGLCGALFAAEIIISDQEKATLIREKFLKEIGAITCREIKRETKTPCIKCIETAAIILDNKLRDFG